MSEIDQTEQAGGEEPVLNRPKSRFKRIRKYIFAVLILLALVYAYRSFGYLVKGDGAIEGKVVQLESREIENKIVSKCQIVPHKSKNYTASAFGTIQEIKAKEGMQVTPGQLLAIVKSDQITTQMQQAQKQLNDAKVKLNQLQTKYNKSVLLYRKDLASQSVVLQARQELNRFKSDTYASAAQNFQEAQNAKKNLKMYAEFGGYVIQQNKFDGDIVSKGDVVVVVAKLNKLYARIYISKLFRDRVNKGLGVEYYPSAGQVDTQIAAGTVNLVSTFIAQKGIMTELTFEPKDKKDQIKYLNQNLVAQIVTDRTPGKVPSLPLSALYVEKNNTYYVYTLKNNVTQKTPVKIGLIGYQYVQIKEGVTDKDKVVIATNKYVLPGMAFKKGG